MRVPPAPRAPPSYRTKLPATLSCEEAIAFTSADAATYTNGQSGLCENSGTIAAVVTANWDLCDGGTITVTYTGVDDCDNALSGEHIITVTPAPPATLTLPTNLPATLSCEEAIAF